ncbi:hypothetical protein EZL74_10705 [Flavobacterium silvisoli]|uniref:DUF3300 domain-containing protein n=1 Tax=Flavobacterium silvisoli TaxID=2529433 RepID=A0A4Q9YSQ2_9FLAO|nr:hypothetical protein [Flavobacterium silvisoli]TBX66644.1 hypothetical protein EZL74_10705 [Flavobacterium silvisoli]
MKTTILSFSILSLLSITSVFAQDRTTVTANSSEISDNLDLRAVASIFGDSENLADFERRLNDPKMQISNLDLNEDNQVDYLRVIETVEGNAHIIVIQSVLGRDTYQDVATVEVQKDRNNKVQIQVVGDVYMYGANYIYEPVYVSTPVIYASFWVGNYRPYYSSWYWGYYPAYYYAWSPYPIFRYRSHIGVCINHHHYYNYVNYRRCEVAYNSYRGRRGNAYETRYPNRSFEHRNTSYANRYELDKTRNIRTVGTRNEMVMNSGRETRNYDSPRNLEQRGNTTRGNSSVSESPRTNSDPRSNSPRVLESNRNNSQVTESPRTVMTQQSSPRVYSNERNVTPDVSTPRGNNRSFESPRNNGSQMGNNRNYSPQSNASNREFSSQRGNSGFGNQGVTRGNNGGNRRG